MFMNVTYVLSDTCKLCIVEYRVDKRKMLATVQPLNTLKNVQHLLFNIKR